jgi:hypothetical protein
VVEVKKGVLLRVGSYLEQRAGGNRQDHIPEPLTPVFPATKFFAGHLTSEASTLTSGDGALSRHPDEPDGLAELVRIKEEYVDANLNWYIRRATLPRVAFRLAGLLTIGLSVSLPVIAIYASAAVTGASLAIAILTALNSFFAWQRTWEKRIRIRMELEGLIAHWQTEMAAARELGDHRQCFEQALTATQQLIARTKAVTTTETSAFFASIRFPEGPRESDAGRPGLRADSAQLGPRS